MRTVEVSTPSKTYQVRLGCGILSQVGQAVVELGRTGQVMVVADSNVDPLYGDTVMNSCHRAGLTAHKYVFAAGEASKTAATLLSLLDAMACVRFTRSDTVLALGGGVTGDLAGLAAALYMRGIGLIQLPTTLLAAVDSSVGGKTAIDLAAGKNLVGTFYQPDLVLCDLNTLCTLPPAEYANGCAEVIKYAFLGDGALLDLLNDPTRLEELVTRCVEMKRDVVHADERDTGIRQTLNFGHTFGHAIEMNSGFTIPHGSAVAVGMVIATRAAVRLGLCREDCLTRLLEALDACGLPKITEFSEETLFSAMLSDKKRNQSGITVVLPEKIGSCTLYRLNLEQARQVLHLGLEEGA